MARASRAISSAALGPGRGVLISGFTGGKHNGRDGEGEVGQRIQTSAGRARRHEGDRRPVQLAVNQTFATIDSEPLDSEEAQAWRDMHGSRSKLLVAVDDTGLIGWARLLPWKQRGFDVVESL